MPRRKAKPSAEALLASARELARLEFESALGLPWTDRLKERLLSRVRDEIDTPSEDELLRFRNRLRDACNSASEMCQLAGAETEELWRSHGDELLENQFMENNRRICRAALELGETDIMGDLMEVLDDESDERLMKLYVLLYRRQPTRLRDKYRGERQRLCHVFLPYAFCYACVREIALVSLLWGNVPTLNRLTTPGEVIDKERSQIRDAFPQHLRENLYTTIRGDFDDDLEASLMADELEGERLAREPALAAMRDFLEALVAIPEVPF